MNPIYKEYYSHENCECYKIDIPWTKYGKDTKVLCKVSEGYNYAATLAIGVIVEELARAMKEEVKEKE